MNRLDYISKKGMNRLEMKALTWILRKRQILVCYLQSKRSTSHQL